MDKSETRTVLRRSILAFMLRSTAVLTAASLLVLELAGGEIAREFFLFSMPVIVLFSVFTAWRSELFRRPSGEAVERFEAANILTATRLFLVPPVIVALIHGMISWAVIMYCMSLATDVADGYVARRFRQETVFGLMLDPFCDIASTFAVVTWLWIVKAVPGWLYVLLIARYSEFFAGMIILKAMGKTPRLKATLPGKVAGVMQGTGIVALLLKQLSPDAMPVAWSIDYIIFPLMALAFLSVIFSQTWIGIEAAREERDWNFRR